MKLSEAVRLGEFALKPIRNRWFDYDDRHQPCGGCAVGRALYAAGYRSRLIEMSAYMEEPDLIAFANTHWPWTREPVTFHPCESVFCRVRGLSGHIVSELSALYERHNWTMAQLADWLETIEPQDDVAATPAPGERVAVEAVTR